MNVYPQISSGPNAHRAWRPIVSTSRRRLRGGEVAVLELAVCVDGFWADVTRVKAAGRPSVLLRDVFAAVKRAQEAALRTIRAGGRGAGSPRARPPACWSRPDSKSTWSI